MSPNKELLSSLSKLSQDLEAETEALNALVVTLEKELTDMGVSVSVWLDDIPLDESEAGTTETVGYKSRTDTHYWKQSWALGFAKVDGSWRIAAKQVRYEVTENGDYVGHETTLQTCALRDAPRHIRVESAPLLDRLLEAIREKTEQYIASIREARANADANHDLRAELDEMK